MDKNSKIVKFYIIKDKDTDKSGNINDLYCYVTKDNTTGKETVHFTRDKDEYQRAFVKCAADNGYKYGKKNILNLFIKYPDRFNVNCKSLREVFDRINADGNNVSHEDFVNSKDKEDAKSVKKDNKEEKKEEKTEEKNNILNKVTNFRILKKARIIIATLLITTTAITIGSCAKSCSNSGNAIVDEADDTKDNDNNKKALDKDKAQNVANTISDAIAKIVNETKKILEAQKAEAKVTKTTPTYNVNNKSSSNSGSGSSSGSSSNSNSNSNSSSTSSGPGNSSSTIKKETTPGSVNKDMLPFQDPDAKLENTEDNDNQNKNEDPYNNLITTEEPVSDDTNKEDYDQEIDVSADDNQDTDKDDIKLDDSFTGNEGAIDNEITVVPPSDYNGDYIYDVLPPQEETAADGNYVSSEDDQAQNISQETTDTLPEQPSIPTDDFVPVEQAISNDETSIYQNEAEQPNVSNYTNTDQTTTEQAVDQAIEAYANGTDGNLVVKTDGSIIFEENTNTNTMEANGMTK